MLEISILVSSLLANLATNFFKSDKTFISDPEELEARTKFLRVINAFAGIVMMLITYFLIGGEIDTAQLTSLIEIVIAGIMTYATSQGFFHLSK